jgi:D-beta-D-heptose 7-phosphate kinase/D-beta-D-heptose 1-phosphate adenosyltransferase
MKRIIVSGYFDPIHVGHLEMLSLARGLGDELVVIVNGDAQAKMKKGRSFMCEEDRLEIVKSIKYVDSAFISVDENATVCKSLKRVRKMYPYSELVFANGGDRKGYEVPEARVCEKLDIEMVDGLGDKIRSSSKYTGLK